MACAAHARASLLEPACSPVSYTWHTGRPLLHFRLEPNGAPRCSHHEKVRYVIAWEPSYRLCLQQKGFSP